MTNLKKVNEGFNKFCGPAVLSILTGKSTDECASVISSINGSYNVTGVYLADLKKAADKLGFDSTDVPFAGHTLFSTLTSIARQDGMYIVSLTDHFVCIEVRDKKIYFCDNHTKEPIPAASSARMMQGVAVVTKVTERPKTEDEIAREILDQVARELREKKRKLKTELDNICWDIMHEGGNIIDSLGDVSLDEVNAAIDVLFSSMKERFNK